MKLFRLLWIMGIALLVGGQSAVFALDQSKKQQQKEQVRAMIESHDYKISVNRAVPMQGRAVNLTSSYSLDLKGDSVISYLPYFGRAYSVPYGGGEGLRFESKMEDYTLTFDKKGKAQINFTTRTKEDRYTFTIQIHDNGSAVIQVTPVNRQGITYYGELDRWNRE